MVNAWSLAYEELYGDMDKEYPIMKKKEDENEVTFLGGMDDDTVSAELPTGNFYAADTVSLSSHWWDDDGFSIVGNPLYTASSDGIDTINFRTDGYPGSIDDINTYAGSHVVGGMGNDHISFNYDHYPSIGSGSTASAEYGFPPKPQPDLDSSVHRKYQEDKGIKDLSDYVSSTYSGHYTNTGTNVQTLDLIHSVGDAESFCRSNAIKYLSRYDKKGQAKRDILKAMHYCLLLYYFSGNTNDEITTHGYETF